MINAQDFSTIDAALDAAEQAGASAVWFPGGIYDTAGFRLRSGIDLRADGNALIRWTGGPGTVIDSAHSGILRDAGISGIDIESRDATTAIAWRSSLECELRDVTVRADNPAQVVLDMCCNADGAANEWGNRNNAYNNVDGLRQRGRCGSLLRLSGLGPPNGPQSAVTTLNSFCNINGAGVCGTGIDFASWADSNHFDGITHLYLIADNAVGMDYNSGAPTENMGVYANSFDHLAVDAFGSFAGRIGLRLNKSGSLRIDHYYNSPVAEGGDLIISPLAAGYKIQHIDPATGEYRLIDPAWMRGYLFEFAVGADKMMIVDKAGNTIQRGIAQVGAGLDTGTAGLELGGWRTGNGYAYIDLIGDTTYGDYGFRVIRNPGPNGHTQLLHRGSGDMALQAQDTGRVTLRDGDGVVRVAVSKAGAGFNGMSPTRPIVSGGTVKDAMLRAALAQLGLIINA